MCVMVTMSFFHDRRCEHGGFGMFEINCMIFLVGLISCCVLSVEVCVFMCFPSESSLRHVV